MTDSNMMERPPVIIDDADDEEFWNRAPTALESARYTAKLKAQNDAETRRKEAESERARKIFGECLRQMIDLGVKEAKARPLLGKWRGQAKDDALLARIISHAHVNGTPDPIGYVTKAIEKAAARAASTDDLMKGKWHELGWEAPRRTPTGMRWRGETRGKVWRDPYGVLKVLPVEDGTVPPTLEDEPGVEV